MSKKVKIGIILVLFFLAILILFFLKYEDKKSDDTFTALQEIASSSDNTNTNSSNNISPSTNTNSNSNEIDNSNEESSYISPPGLSSFSFDKLYSLNNHFMGWINIPLTCVDYPVVQYKEEKDYYLYKDFYKKYSSYGVPYIDERYDIDSSQNLVIYGHAMHNNTMFSDLKYFISNDFYQKSNIIQYTDKNGYHKYKIFSVFGIDINEPFDYHNYINMGEERFNEFIENAISQSEYDTGIIPQFGDKLITLSTCENTYDDRRFVVVGVKIN